MNALSYLIQVNLYLFLFYGLYHLILRNETFFKLNRLYLMGFTFLSMAIPLLKAEWIKDFFVTEQIYDATQTVSNMVITAPLIGGTVYPDLYNAPLQHQGLNANQIFWIIYGSITFLLLLNFFRKLYLVNRAFKNSPGHQAFSFFNKVLVDHELEGKETILDHEMVHVRQWHSFDVIFFELFAAFNWFNPIAFACKRAIKNIHEFIADDLAASTLEDRSAYTLLLVSNVFNTQPHKLTNNFFNQSLLKRRIMMLHKTKSRKAAILKYGLSAPLFAIMVIFSSATIEKSEAVKEITAKIEENIPSLVRAIIKEPAIQKDQLGKTDSIAVKTETNKKTEGLISEKTENPALKVLTDYFNKSIRYPASDQEDRLIGTTLISIEVDETGAIQKPSMISAISAASYYEVIRVIKQAKPFGEGMKGKYILPIKFSLSATSGLITKAYESHSKDSINLKQFNGYQTIDGIHIRGYLSAEAIKEANRQDLLLEYFSMSAVYPSTDKQNGISGYNLVAFELDQAGAIQNPSFIAVMNSSAQDEIMKLIKSAKPFGEGTESGYLLPVIFSSGEPLTTETPKLGKFNNYKRLKSIIINANGARPIYPKTSFPITEAPQSFTYSTVDETKTEAGKIVNYIKVEYLTKPVILVDGKEAGYSITETGFKLDNTIYPKHANIMIYTREAAVKNFNESARDRGLIVITTGSKAE